MHGELSIKSHLRTLKSFTSSTPANLGDTFAIAVSVAAGYQRPGVLAQASSKHLISCSIGCFYMSMQQGSNTRQGSGQLPSYVSSKERLAGILSSSASNKLPATPQEQACPADTSSLRSASCSSMSTSTSFASGSQRKRKAAGKPSSARSISTGSKLKPEHANSASFDSDLSSTDCMLTWSQSYAASRASSYPFDAAAASQWDEQPPKVSCGLLCQEGLEIAEDEPRTCNTGYSSLSSGSSQSEHLPIASLPAKILKHGLFCCSSGLNALPEIGAVPA